MTFTTAFNIGDRVRANDRRDAFIVAEIRIQTLGEGLVLIEYRARYATGRNGQWWAERYLSLAGLKRERRLP